MYTLVSQPYDGNLEQELIDYINSNDVEQIFIVVAYAKVSGVRKLLTHFNSLLQSNCQITVCVGIDQTNTSTEAIEMLLQCTSELYIFHIENLTVTVHPKLYYIKSETNEILFVGSNNLTQGGLETNDEIFTSITEITEPVRERLNAIIERYTDLNTPFCNLVTQDFIEDLVRNGYILSENQINSRLLSNRNNGPSNQNQNITIREVLFGTTNRRSSTPRYTVAPTETDTSDTEIIEAEPNDVQLTEQDMLALLEEIETYETIYEDGYEEFIDTITETKAYYHIPQGVHLGHIFYIVKSLGDISHSPLDYRLTIFEDLTSGPYGELVRQTRYKLALSMELLLVDDYRLHISNSSTSPFQLNLGSNGEILYQVLENYVNDPANFYAFRNNDQYTWNMLNSKQFYNNFIINLPVAAKEVVFQVVRNLSLFEITIRCIGNLRSPTIDNNYFYNDLWNEPEIVNWMNLIRNGVPFPRLNVPTHTSLEHRIPFIIDLLNTFNIIEWDNSNRNYIIL